MKVDSAILRALQESGTASNAVSCNVVGSAFRLKTDNGLELFVKTNTGAEAKEKAEAEYSSLTAIEQAAPGFAPKAYAHGILEDSSGSFCMSQYIQLGSLSDSGQAALGKRLAEMHSHNLSSNEVQDFGYDIPTYCGDTKMDNTRSANWAEFFANRRIRDLSKRIAKEQGDSPLLELAEQVAEEVVPFLCGSKDIKPSLLHGDMWSSNRGLNSETQEPVIYDPCCYFGHNEAELGMMRMFGGFSSRCFEAYHKVIPRLQPHYEERQQLYLLYHQLNHAYLFGGGGYRSTAMRIMKELVAFVRQAKT